jgi:hypothetical protein
VRASVKTKFTPIVHPKMNTGKECSRAECARLRSRLHCVTTRRVASTRQGVRRAPQFDFRHRQASCASPREIMPAVKNSHCFRHISLGEPCEIMPRAKASHCLRRISQGEPRAPLPLRHSECAPRPRFVDNSPAIHGWDSWSANFQSPVRDERSLRTATTFSAVPRGTFIFDGHITQP